MKKRALQLKQKGFTAIEMIIVLIVGFSIIALSASKMGELFSGANTAEAASSILSLYAAGKGLSSTNGYGEAGADLVDSLQALNALPRNLGVDSSGKAINEWGGQIKMPISADSLGFDLEYPAVPKDSCAKLAQQMLISGNFSQIQINGTALERTATATAIAASCSEEKNTLTFTVNGQENDA